MLFRVFPILTLLLFYGRVNADTGNFTHTIYLVRHGAYFQDPKADPAVRGTLTPLGIAQARLVATRLQSLPFRFDSMTSSPLERARQTSAIIYDTLREVPLQVSPDVAECAPPTFAPAKEAPAHAMAQCTRQLDHAFADRFQPASGSNRNDLIIAHGSVIRYLATKALGIDTRSWDTLFIAHTSVTVIQVNSSGKFKVLSIGDIVHIPPNLQSWGTDADPQLSLAK